MKKGRSEGMTSPPVVPSKSETEAISETEVIDVELSLVFPSSIYP